MALVVTDDKHYKDIADVIRNEAVAHGAKFKPEMMAAEVKGACDYKYYEGHLAGDAEGFERGKQAEYDAFWDAFQRNGRRQDYQFGFAGSGWSELIFKPKYKIAPTGSYDGKGLFFHFKVFDSTVLDYREIADMIDLTQVTNASNIFNSALINYIDVDFSNATNLDACFSNEWNQTYRTHITLKVSEKCTSYVATFLYSSALTHLLFKEGSKIAANLSVSSSTKLVKESIESIVRALWDNASGKTLTLSITAIKKAFETSSGANDGNTSEEWLTLVASKSNWTITLS